jgi:hypothetical protein
MTSSDARNYEFGIVGHVDEHWSVWFADLAIVRHADGTSTLAGPVADQAELHGILARLRDCGATLLSVRAVSSDCPRLGDPREAELPSQRT